MTTFPITPPGFISLIPEGALLIGESLPVSMPLSSSPDDIASAHTTRAASPVIAAARASTRGRGVLPPQTAPTPASVSQRLAGLSDWETPPTPRVCLSR